MVKEFPRVFLEPEKEKDIKTWVTETLEKFEGTPITEASRDFILSKYNEFKNLLTQKYLAMYLEPCVSYSESEWELHTLLVNIIRSFSSILNDCNKKLNKEMYQIQEYRAKGKILEFDESYKMDDLWEVL